MLVREPGLFTSLATIVMAPDSPRVLSESRHPVTDIGIGQLITLVLDGARRAGAAGELTVRDDGVAPGADGLERSEEHTSELQSLAYLVCRLLLEKKKKNTDQITHRKVSDINDSAQ